MLMVEQQLWEKGRDQEVCEEGEEGSFSAEPLLHGGNPLFMVVTPSSWW
jgi:hypothetical protein